MKIIKLSEQKIKEFKAKYSDADSKNLTVTLKSGKKIKLANYDNGYLELPRDADFETEDVISIDPAKTADQTKIDNAENIYPHVNQVYPAVDEDTQKKDAEFEKQREELRKKSFKDASGKLKELIEKLQSTAEKYFEQNHLKNGVLKVTQHNNIMNLDKLKEIKATVNSTENPAELKEAFANTVLFAEELAKKSEQMEAAFADHKKLMEDALKQKADSDKIHETVKKELEGLKSKLQEMEDGHKASEAEHKFNARMTKLDADYDMDDACRSHVAKDMRGMSDEEYASYEMKLSALMHEKSKTYKNELAEKLRASLEDSKVVDPKPSTKKHGDQFKGKKTDEDEAEASLIEALASAGDNLVDPLFNTNDLAKIPNLKELLTQSFGKDVTIGGETVANLEVKRKKKLE